MKEYNIGDLVLLTLDSPGPVGITEGLSQYKERKFRISKVKTIIPKNKSAGSRATYYELKGCVSEAGIDFADKEVWRALEEAPTIKTKEIKYFDEDEKIWKIGRVIVDE